jgi:hypothetical protein
MSKLDNIRNCVLNIFKKTYNISPQEEISVVTLTHLREKDFITLRDKSKKAKLSVLVFLFDVFYFEPESKISKQLLQFADLLKYYGIFNCNFFISSNFTNHNEETIKYLNKNFYDWKFFDFHIDFPFCYHYQKLETLDPVDSNLYLENSTMKFSHLNFTQRMHRQLFSKFLIKENLVSSNLVAINNYNDSPFLNKKDSKHKINQTDLLIGTETADDWFYNKNLLNLYKNVNLTYHKHKDITNNLNSPYLEFLSKSAIHIVSESVFNYPFQYFSEKIISSLLSKRPFILIGPSQSLKYLKQKGFQTFETLFDESYDAIDDPNQRLETIMKLVLKLNQKSQTELNDMVYSAKEILIHNYCLTLEKFKNFCKQ